MSKENRRDFDKVAASWDEKPERRLLAAAVAAGIAKTITLHSDMHALEYGCGTGLVGLQLAGKIGRVSAVDTSVGMLAELRKKSRSLGLGNVTPLLISPDYCSLPAATYDLVFTSMVLHHIEETEVLFRHFHQVLKPGGFLALADLEREDGSFHEDPTGIAHHGFNPQALLLLLKGLGFTGLQAKTIHTVRKQREGKELLYPVFLITGQKPS
jgi:ubiquinone/menaquinone biosynthesis C-methylase UbiE